MGKREEKEVWTCAREGGGVSAAFDFVAPLDEEG